MTAYETVSENTDCSADREPAEATGARERAKGHEESSRDPKGISLYTPTHNTHTHLFKTQILSDTLRKELQSEEFSGSAPLSSSL